MKPDTAPTTNTDRVIESFQQTMRAFLEVERSTMLAYLSARGAAAASPLAPALKPESTDRVPIYSQPVAPLPPQMSIAPEPDLFEPAQEIDRQVPLNLSTPPASEASHAASNGKPHAPDATSAAVCDLSRDTIAARLLETVRDRTGYPIETLGLDLDMEADLGIDSIKRVEILGKMRDEFPTLKALSDSAEAMDALARARTLGVIVDRMAALAEKMNGTSDLAISPPASPLPSSRSTNGNGKPHELTQRRLLEPVDSPLPVERLGLMPGGRVIITDDRSGAASELASLLEAADIAVHRLGGSDHPVDWTSPSAVDSVVERLRSKGPIAGIVHTLPLVRTRQANSSDPDWAGRLGTEVRGLFLLAKAAAADLETAARAGGSCLIAATALGGRFASSGSAVRDFFPGSGGVAGLVKTLAREWPSIRCRVVDFSPDAATRSHRLPVGRRDLRERRLPRSRLRGRSPHPPSFRHHPALPRAAHSRAETRRSCAHLWWCSRHHRSRRRRAGTHLAGNPAHGRNNPPARRSANRPTPPASSPSPKSRPPFTRGFATTANRQAPLRSSRAIRR